MLINSKYDRREKVLSFLNSMPGYFSNTTEYAPYLHELGHKYYEECIKRLAISKNIEYNKSKIIIDSLLDDYVHKRNDDGDFLSTHISVHADRCYEKGKLTELVAECFSSYTINETAR